MSCTDLSMISCYALNLHTSKPQTIYPTTLFQNLISNLDAQQLIMAGFILQLPFIPGLKSRGFQAILL